MISFLILSYLAGSIPFGLVLTRISGLGDIRHIGSGNIGATNVLRTGNKKIAIATLLCDFLKGYIPTLSALLSYQDALYGVAIVCVLGHVFPIWLRFKGGKGVATAFGVYFAIDPLVGLLSLVSWGIVAKVFRISSLSALISFSIAPLFVYARTGISSFFYFSFFILLLLIWTHRSNILRLINNAESAFDQSRKP